MDKFKLFFRSLSRRDLDDLLKDAQHDRPKARADNSAGSDNNNIQITIGAHGAYQHQLAATW